METIKSSWVHRLGMSAGIFYDEFLIGSLFSEKHKHIFTMKAPEIEVPFQINSKLWWSVLDIVDFVDYLLLNCHMKHQMVLS